MFFVKQPLRKATEFVSKLLAQLSAILLVFASARVHFSCRLCHCVCALQYSAHVCVSVCVCVCVDVDLSRLGYWAGG